MADDTSPLVTGTNHRDRRRRRRPVPAAWSIFAATALQPAIVTAGPEDSDTALITAVGVHDSVVRDRTMTMRWRAAADGLTRDDDTTSWLATMVLQGLAGSAAPAPIAAPAAPVPTTVPRP